MDSFNKLYGWNISRFMILVFVQRKFQNCGWSFAVNDNFEVSNFLNVKSFETCEKRKTGMLSKSGIPMQH